jgi:Superinfection immunity protein
VTGGSGDAERRRHAWREPKYAALIVTAFAIMAAAAFSSHPHLERWVAFLLVLPVALIYLLPTYVATLRSHHKLVAIAAVNVLLGWTILGWIVAVVWSFTTMSPVDGTS